MQGDLNPSAVTFLQEWMTSLLSSDVGSSPLPWTMTYQRRNGRFLLGTRISERKDTLCVGIREIWMKTYFQRSSAARRAQLCVTMLVG
jgi:hypothetical protein